MERINLKTKVITGKRTRWSYANVWEPKSINGGAPKYSVTLLIPKDDHETLLKIHDAVYNAYIAGERKLKGSDAEVPAFETLKVPLRDGDKDRPQDKAYRNHYFINATSKMAPGIVDANKQKIINTCEVYSGVYGRASIDFYAFNGVFNGVTKKGIACCLINLQKISDGESIASKPSPEEDFKEE